MDGVRIFLLLFSINVATAVSADDIGLDSPATDHLQLPERHEEDDSILPRPVRCLKKEHGLLKPGCDHHCLNHAQKASSHGSTAHLPSKGSQDYNIHINIENNQHMKGSLRHQVKNTPAIPDEHPLEDYSLQIALENQLHSNRSNAPQPGNLILPLLMDYDINEATATAELHQMENYDSPHDIFLHTYPRNYPTNGDSAALLNQMSDYEILNDILKHHRPSGFGMQEDSVSKQGLEDFGSDLQLNDYSFNEDSASDYGLKHKNTQDDFGNERDMQEEDLGNANRELSLYNYKINEDMDDEYSSNKMNLHLDEEGDHSLNDFGIQEGMSYVESKNDNLHEDRSDEDTWRNYNLPDDLDKNIGAERTFEDVNFHKGRENEEALKQYNPQEYTDTDHFLRDYNDQEDMKNAHALDNYKIQENLGNEYPLTGYIIHEDIGDEQAIKNYEMQQNLGSDRSSTDYHIDEDIDDEEATKNYKMQQNLGSDHSLKNYNVQKDFGGERGSKIYEMQENSGSRHSLKNYDVQEDIGADHILKDHKISEDFGNHQQVNNFNMFEDNRPDQQLKKYEIQHQYSNDRRLKNFNLHENINAHQQTKGYDFNENTDTHHQTKNYDVVEETGPDREMKAYKVQENTGSDINFKKHSLHEDTGVNHRLKDYNIHENTGGKQHSKDYEINEQTEGDRTVKRYKMLENIRSHHQVKKVNVKEVGRHFPGSDLERNDFNGQDLKNYDVSGDLGGNTGLKNNRFEADFASYSQPMFDDTESSLDMERYSPSGNDRSTGRYGTFETIGQRRSTSDKSPGSDFGVKTHSLLETDRDADTYGPFETMRQHERMTDQSFHNDLPNYPLPLSHYYANTKNSGSFGNEHDGKLFASFETHGEERMQGNYPEVILDYTSPDTYGNQKHDEVNDENARIYEFLRTVGSHLTKYGLEKAVVMNSGTFGPYQNGENENQAAEDDFNPTYYKAFENRHQLDSNSEEYGDVQNLPSEMHRRLFENQHQGYENSDGENIDLYKEIPEDVSGKHYESLQDHRSLQYQIPQEDTDKLEKQFEERHSELMSQISDMGNQKLKVESFERNVNLPINFNRKRYKSLPHVGYQNTRKDEQILKRDGHQTTSQSDEELSNFNRKHTHFNFQNAEGHDQMLDQQFEGLRPEMSQITDENSGLELHKMDGFTADSDLLSNVNRKHYKSLHNNMNLEYQGFKGDDQIQHELFEGHHPLTSQITVGNPGLQHHMFEDSNINTDLRSKSDRKHYTSLQDNSHLIHEDAETYGQILHQQSEDLHNQQKNQDVYENSGASHGTEVFDENKDAVSSLYRKIYKSLENSHNLEHGVVMQRRFEDFSNQRKNPDGRGTLHSKTGGFNPRKHLFRERNYKMNEDTEGLHQNTRYPALGSIRNPKDRKRYNLNRSRPLRPHFGSSEENQSDDETYNNRDGYYKKNHKPEHDNDGGVSIELAIKTSPNINNDYANHLSNTNYERHDKVQSFDEEQPPQNEDSGCFGLLRTAAKVLMYKYNIFSHLKKFLGDCLTSYASY